MKTSGDSHEQMNWVDYCDSLSEESFNRQSGIAAQLRQPADTLAQVKSTGLPPKTAAVPD